MSKINSDSPVATAATRLGRDMATAVIGFHETLARKLGMSAAESRTLTTLNELGLATPGQLAQATGLSTGAITGIVDRLEKSGHAARKPNPDDRRSLLIEPLKQDALNQIMRPAFASLGAAMTTMSAKYTPEELSAIQRYLLDTTAVLREETRKLRGD